MTRAELYGMLTEAMREAKNVQAVSGYPADWMHRRVSRILADKLAANHRNFDRTRFLKECAGESTPCQR